MYLCVNRIGNPSLCALIICKKNEEFRGGRDDDPVDKSTC